MMVRVEKELETKLGEVLSSGKTIGSLRCLGLVVFFFALSLGEHIVSDADVADFGAETVEKKIFKELEDLIAANFE